MQLFSAVPTMFSIFFVHKKLKKKTSSKVAQKNSNPLFFLTALTTAQTEEFMFQNVAKRTTVYRTGAAVILSSNIKGPTNRSWIQELGLPRKEAAS